MWISNWTYYQWQTISFDFILRDFILNEIILSRPYNSLLLKNFQLLNWTEEPKWTATLRYIARELTCAFVQVQTRQFHAEWLQLSLTSCGITRCKAKYLRMLSTCAVLNVQTACPFKQKRDIIKWSFFHLVAPLFKNAIIYLYSSPYLRNENVALFIWLDRHSEEWHIN